MSAKSKAQLEAELQITNARIIELCEHNVQLSKDVSKRDDEIDLLTDKLSHTSSLLAGEAEECEDALKEVSELQEAVERAEIKQESAEKRLGTVRGGLYFAGKLASVLEDFTKVGEMPATLKSTILTLAVAIEECKDVCDDENPSLADDEEEVTLEYTKEDLDGEWVISARFVPKEEVA